MISRLGHIRAFFVLALGLLAFSATVSTPSTAYAAVEICTDTNPQDFAVVSMGVITSLSNEITTTLRSLSSRMFTGIAQGLSQSGLIKNLCMLYILIYGVLFMFGAAQMSLYDFIVRMAKVYAVLAITYNGAFLYSLMYRIFETGTEELIDAVVASMYGGTGGGALGAMDNLLNITFSPKMMVIIAAIATTGTYGPILFIIISTSINSIISSILNAMWVYLMAKVVRCLLFGVAPIFIACVLFQKTRDLFNGWLNQLVNSCLQPVLLFAFFAFFIHVMVDVINVIAGPKVNVCRVTASDIATASYVDTKWWRFKVDINGQSVPYEYAWGPDGPLKIGNNQPPPFPIDVYTIAVLFILAELGSRLNGIVMSIASGISNASAQFGSLGSIMRMMGQDPTEGRFGNNNNDPSRGAAAQRDVIRGMAGKRK